MSGRSHAPITARGYDSQATENSGNRLHPPAGADEAAASDVGGSACAAASVAVAVQSVRVRADFVDGDRFLVGGQVAAVQRVSGEVGEARRVSGVAVRLGSLRSRVGRVRSRSARLRLDEAPWTIFAQSAGGRFRFRRVADGRWFRLSLGPCGRRGLRLSRGDGGRGRLGGGFLRSAGRCQHRQDRE